MSAAALRLLRRVSLCCCLMLGVTVAVLPGCSRSQPAPHPQVDDSLRVFLGVKSLTAKLQVPPGEDFFTFHVLNFHDGKLVEDAVCMPSKLSAGNSREMTMELLWGEQRGETVVTLFLSSADSHGWSRQTGNTARFWKMFDRSTAQVVNTQSKPVDHLGYKILAFVQSNGSSRRTPVATNFDEAVLNQPYVGAIAVKTYASQEAMDKFVHADRGTMRY
jgi:hypothetical protein